MPWGWECKSKFVKQIPSRPTQPRRAPAICKSPGPNSYETPQIFCGKGYSNIKRAPAYTFGERGQDCAKVSDTPMTNTFGLACKGQYKVTHGVVLQQIKPLKPRTKTPGPAAYDNNSGAKYKRPPSYTMRPAARHPYEPWDQWTPAPNMYLPFKPTRKPPSFSLGYVARDLKQQRTPSPGEYEPKFNYVQKTKPAFSFGEPFKDLKPPQVPAPNRYCEKKFMYPNRTMPAPSFGIRHSKYIGRQDVYLLPLDYNISVSGDT